jgi:hypothetical protein
LFYVGGIHYNRGIPKERNSLKEFYVETLVRFSGTIQADTEAEAEELGYYMENLNYESVESIDIELVADYEEDEDE